MKGLRVEAAGEQRGAALGRGLAEKEVPDQRGELPQHRADVLAALVELTQLQERPLGIPLEYGFQQPDRLYPSGEAQDIQHGLGVDAAAGGCALIEKRERVPQRSVRQPGQELRAALRQGDALLPGYVLEPGLNVFWLDAPEGEALAAGEDGGRDLVKLRGGENEHQVLRRLLQDLQQGVEGREGQHVDLVDDIDPLFDSGGGVDGLVPQGPDLVHTVIGRGVQLQNVQKAAVLNAKAGGTGAAGVPVHGMLAVYGLGENFRAGGLSGAPGAGEEVSVGGAAFGHLLLQGLGDMALPRDVREGLGPPLAVEGLIHASPPPF